MNTKEAICNFLAGQAKWYTQKQLATMVDRGASTLVPPLQELVASKAIQRAKPPAGANEFRGAHAIFAVAGLALPTGAKSLKAAASRRTPKLPPKVKGFRAEARAHKRAKRKPHVTPAKRVQAPALQVPRWALTADGAFINLTDNLEIGRAEARGLVDFVRRLDAGEA